MITNKDIRVENGFLIINGDKYPLDGQSPETIMEIVEDNSDTTPTENSTAPITSGGVFTALGTKQDTLTFDTTPTDDSTNPVTSGGVYESVSALERALEGIHPDATSVVAQVLKTVGVQDICIELRETGNDDYKGIAAYDKDGNERYRLYFTGGHLKFTSKAADGSTIVDTVLA